MTDYVPDQVQISPNPDMIRQAMERLNTNLAAIAGVLEEYPEAATLIAFMAQRAASNGLATLDENGKIVSEQLPAITINTPYSVDSEAEMLALECEQGDLAIRSDESKTYILSGDDPAELADWIYLPSPSGAVTSVQSRTGDVTLSDIFESLSHKATANGYPSLNSSSKVVQDPASRGAANGVASLNASVLVQEDPANATATPTASKIPKADGSGKLAAGWGGGASSLATTNAGGKVVENPASATATPTAGAIPIADGNGTLNAWITASALPPGAIISYGGNVAPEGFAACDGAEYSRTEEAALFANVGTLWGAGNGTTTFNVPNLPRMALVGSGGTATAVLGNTVGSTGGAETHTLLLSESPSHDHGGNTGGSSENVRTYTTVSPTDQDNQSGLSPNERDLNTHTHGISSAGGDGAHNNVQPSAVVMWIIKK